MNILSSLLSFAQPLAQKYNQYQDQVFMDRLYGANPDVAQKYFGTIEDQKRTAQLQQQAQIQQQEAQFRRQEYEKKVQEQEALKRYAASIPVDNKNPYTGYLAGYAQTTGDLNPLFEYMGSQQMTPYQQAQLALQRDQMGMEREKMNRPEEPTEYDRQVGFINDALKAGQINQDQAKRFHMQALGFEDLSSGGKLPAGISLPVGTMPVFDESGNLVSAQPIPGIVDPEQQIRDEKAVSRDLSKRMSSRNVFDSIDSARKLINYPATEGVQGQVSQFIGATPAYELNQEIETIKSNLAVDQLQKMREMSPTGGALGNSSDKDLAALQTTVASLKVGMSDKAKANALQKIDRHYTGWLGTTYKTPDDVKNDFQSGFIDGKRAKAILQERFGYK
jgi:hypothetical protein